MLLLLWRLAAALKLLLPLHLFTSLTAALLLLLLANCLLWRRHCETNFLAGKQNTMALKDEPSPKYASRGWNVPSEILPKIAFFPPFEKLLAAARLAAAALTATAAAGLAAAAATATAAAPAAAAAKLALANACETPPGSKTLWP